MRKLASFALFSSGILAALPLAAQPVVTAIENNYSYIPAGLPGYGIAQGSIFVIFGTGLAPASSPLQSAPLKTSLDGVSVQFDVQGATSQALLYYVTPTQIGGILPSATPTGSGTVTVTSGAQTSATFPLTVVQSAVGFLSQGFFPTVTDGTHQLEFGIYAANPGETLVLYGTGAGPVSGDESVPQTPQNLSNIPLEIDIGGISATIAYHGRSIYPGLDQFNVVVPSGATGCNVSLYAHSGSFLSNVVLIPVAASGRTCSDPSNTSGSVQFQGTGSTQILGSLFLSSTEVFTPSTSGPPIGAITDAGAADFQEQTFPPVATVTGSSSGYLPSLGGCLVNAYAIPLPPPPVQTYVGPPLANAGPAINITGPNGFASVPSKPGLTGDYDGPLSLVTGQQFIPAAGGSFTFDNGSGGPDVGAFKQQVAVPPPLAWTNIASIGPTVDRTQPLTVQWSGGNPAGYVEILGQSALHMPTQVVGVTLQCTAPASAGQFTVPPAVLMALPPQADQYASAGTPTLTLETETGSTFTAPGVTAGLVNVLSSVQLPVGLQ